MHLHLKTVICQNHNIWYDFVWLKRLNLLIELPSINITFTEKAEFFLLNCPPSISQYLDTILLIEKANNACENILLKWFCENRGEMSSEKTMHVLFRREMRLWKKTISLSLKRLNFFIELPSINITIFDTILFDWKGWQSMWE